MAHGRTVATEMVYGKFGSVYRDRTAVHQAAPPKRRLSPERVAAVELRRENHKLRQRLAERDERDAERRAASDFAHLRAVLPAILPAEEAPPDPARTLAARIVNAGDRRRAGTGSAQPVAKPRGVAARIIAAGKRRRGEGF